MDVDEDEDEDLEGREEEEEGVEGARKPSLREGAGVPKPELEVDGRVCRGGRCFDVNVGGDCEDCVCGL